MTQTVFSTDLAGIQVGETRISNVDGENGVLSYRGVAIEQLIDRPFLQVVWLLLTGSEPDIRQETELQTFISAHSCLSKQELSILDQLPSTLHPMLMLQCLVPALELSSDTRISGLSEDCLLYTSPSPRDLSTSRMPSSA